MRAKPHQLQRRFIWFAVDQHQIGLYVAIAVVFPFAGQRVIAETWLQRRVRCQCTDKGDEIALQCLAVLTFALALQVFLELAGLLNRPHREPLAGR